MKLLKSIIFYLAVLAVEVQIRGAAKYLIFGLIVGLLIGYNLK